MAQLKNLIVNGVARVVGKVFAYEFVGKLTGNADTATKATQDSAGQQINTTYIKGLSVSGTTITYTKGNGTTGTITTQNTVYTHPNSGVTAGTYSSVTVNAQGHVTSGSNPTLAAVPVGTIIAFSGTKIPSGYLVCNGAAVGRSTYSALFSAIETIYGSGDGSTTFNLPNLTDKFIEGSDTAGTSIGAGLPNITGSMTIASYGGFDYADAFANSSNKSSGANGDWGSGYNMGYHYIKFNASGSNSIYGASTTVQPPALTMRYIIKY